MESSSFDDNALVHGFCRGGEELVGRLLARVNAICAAEDGADGRVQAAAGGDDDFDQLIMDTLDRECVEGSLEGSLVRHVATLASFVQSE